jgi:hypothetical protein
MTRRRITACLLTAAVLLGCDREPDATAGASSETPPVWSVFQETYTSRPLGHGDGEATTYELLEAPPFIELEQDRGRLVTNPDRRMPVDRYRIRFAVVGDDGRREHELILQVMPVL